MAKVVLLAGPSGSGKSYVARRTGLPVLPLDDFYLNGDDPRLPRRDGRVDWESPTSWDAAAAMAAIELLARTGAVEVPRYDISADRCVGYQRLALSDAPLFVAEGIFAADIAATCRDRGVLAGAFALRRPRAVTFTRRLARDLVERRKPPTVLVRRGVTLYRTEPKILERQTRLGCRPATAGEIRQWVGEELSSSPRPVSG